MRLTDLARALGAAIAVPGRDPQRELRWVYAGDRISDLLAAAADDVLLVSNIKSPQLFRMANLLDIPAICLLDGTVPGPTFIREAEQSGAVVLVSPYGMFETCGRLYHSLVRA